MGKMEEAYNVTYWIRPKGRKNAQDLDDGTTGVTTSGWRCHLTA